MSETETWDPSKWTCRQDVLIDSAGGTSYLTDYQVKVTLATPDFDFAGVADDGADLRFTDSEGTTLLDYWIESFSKPERTGVVWVQVPRIPAGSTKTIHLFRYLDEEDFRFNKRKMDDAGRFLATASAVAGKRLTYNQLIGESETA